MRVSLHSTPLGHEPGCLSETRHCRALKKLAPALPQHPKLRERRRLMGVSACVWQSSYIRQK